MNEKKIDLNVPVLTCNFNKPGGYNFNSGIRRAIARLDPAMTIAAFCRKSRGYFSRRHDIGKKHMAAIDGFLSMYGLRLGMSQKDLDEYSSKAALGETAMGAVPEEKAYTDWIDDPRNDYLSLAGCIKLEDRPDGTYVALHVIIIPFGKAEDREFRVLMEILDQEGYFLEQQLDEGALYGILRDFEMLLTIKKKAAVENTPAVLRLLRSFHPDTILTSDGRDLYMTTQWTENAAVLSGHDGERFVMRLSRDGQKSQFAITFTERELDFAAEAFARMLHNVSILNGRPSKWGGTCSEIRVKARLDANAINAMGCFTRLSEDLENMQDKP